jgi:2-oxoglutarate ferredoxin oxidoreductase subunit alpha
MARGKRAFTGEVSVVLCGAAGKGIQTIEHLLTRLLKREGYHVYASKEYESRVRGGSNSTQLRVGAARVGAFVDRIDLLIPLDREAVEHVRERLSPRSVILGEAEVLKTDLPVVEVPLSKMAAQAGGAITGNLVAVGVLAALFGLNRDAVLVWVGAFFEKKGEEVARKNVEALTLGFDFGAGLAAKGAVRIDIPRDPATREEMLVDGSEAVAYGALAGGCNFVCAYPMSPSTGVLTALARLSGEFDVVVEQCEDEIAVVNMALGAWFAGARALATTSGGGFALMCEGMSLAGMMEMPLVVHLAQRPGPATGLSTRTEQGDLNLALYAGHGDFPRVLYAPGTVEQAFSIARMAFKTADEMQAPVVILTDQYLVDSFTHIPWPDLGDLDPAPAVVRTRADYKRYAFTMDGLSPRGVPGLGEGLVTADSHEHDEEGHITEDKELRVRMQDKRTSRHRLLAQRALPPELVGDPDYRTLFVGWGSTLPVVREALALLKRKRVAFLHFSQVWPLHPEAEGLLRKAKRLVAVEQNASGQFAALLRQEYALEFHDFILKYDGRPFSVEEMAGLLGDVL